MEILLRNFVRDLRRKTYEYYVERTVVDLVFKIVPGPTFESVKRCEGIQKTFKFARWWKPHVSVVTDDLRTHQTKRNTKIN